MTSEKRVVRPYKGVDVFQEVLASAHVRIGGRSVGPGERLTMSSSSFLHDPVIVALGEDEDDVEKKRRVVVEAAETMGIDPGHLELLVIASTPYLKLLDVVHQERLDRVDAIPRDLKLIRDDVQALRTPSGGCDLEVAFVLSEDQPPEPLRPRRRGTWLGRVRFKLRTDLGERGFTPRRLTPEKRAALRLPDGTVRYIEVDADALLLADIDDAVELYVDETVLAFLDQARDSVGARLFQRQLFIDVVSAIVRAAQRIDGFEGLELAEIENSALLRIVEMAALLDVCDTEVQRNVRLEEALKLLKNQSELFVARVEAAASVRDDLVATIRGMEG